MAPAAQPRGECYYCREEAKEMGERHREGEPSCGDGFTHKDAPDDIPTEPTQHSDPAFVVEDEALVRNRIMLLLMVQMANKSTQGSPPTSATKKARRVKPGREYDTSGSSVPTAMVGHTARAEDATTDGSRRGDPHADMSYGTSCWAHTFEGQRVHQKVSSGVELLFFCYDKFTVLHLIRARLKIIVRTRCIADCGNCGKNKYRELVHTYKRTRQLSIFEPMTITGGERCYCTIAV